MKQGLKRVTGQASLVELISGSISSGRVSHAYIIEGDTGMGKKTLAHAFAQHLVCHDGSGCGNCSHCQLFSSGNHPDVITVLPDDGKQSVSVDNIRALYQQVMIRPHSANKKVIIIPGCEKLGIPAQNALLKMLEEPPSYVVFLLITTNSNYFLETVLSRSIKLTLMPYTEDEIKEILKEYGFSSVPDQVIACADGNAGKALSIMSGGTFLALRKELAGMFDLFFDKPEKIFELVSFLEANKDLAGDIFDIFSGFARQLVLCHIGLDDGSDGDFIPAEYMDKTTLKACMAFSDKVIESKKMLLSNVNYSLLANSFTLGSREVLGW